MVIWDIEIVGGPYDGTQGLYLSGEATTYTPPGTLWLGHCRGDDACNAVDCPGQPHAAHWLEREHEIMPPNAIPYALREIDDDEQLAVYALGGVEPVLTTVHEDELPPIEQTNPLVPA